jgi:hypothetical protein
MSDTRKTAIELATAQRGMMWMLAIKFAMDSSTGIVQDMAKQPAQAIFFVAYLAVSFVVAYFVFKIARIIYGDFPGVACGLLVFAPCIGTLTVLVLNGTTMDRLRKLGVKSGFFGANRLEMEKLMVPEPTDVTPPQTN